ncbi:DUF2341 domain-containing protein [Mucilaginibacter sp.]|uniref:DUF2341 domain-containing protein n=1 Tax=Mucilaginibacter sp. TaxID=1882438 RepID=UPI003266792E
MKKLLLHSAAVLLIVFYLPVLKVSAQQVTYTSTNQFYYNPFDDSNLGVLNNYIQGTTNKTIVTASTTSTSFNNTVALTSVPTVNSRNNIYGQIIATADRNLNNNDFEWTFQYKNNSSTSPVEPYDNNLNAGPSSGQGSWQYWLTANTNDQASSTVQGFYMTQVGTNMILRYRNNSNDIQSLITFAITNNVLWTVKVQRLSTGRWIVWANPVSTNSEAVTYQGQNDQSAFNNYVYSMLATTDLRTAGNNFYWDNIKIYTRKISFTGLNSAGVGITQPSFYPNQTNAALFGMQVSIRGTYSINSINIGYTNSLGTNPNAFFTNGKIVKSIDDSFTTTGDNTTIASFSPNSTPLQSGTITGGDPYYTSGNTDGSLTRVSDYFLVVDVLSSINYGNPAPYTTYVFTGPAQVTTADYQLAPVGGYTNNAATGNNTITFVNGPPTISYPSPQTYTVGTAITTLTPTTTNSPTSYSTTGLPPGLSLNTSNGQITGTPTTSSVATNYTVTATNAAGNGSATINITVNGPPIISYLTPQSYPVNTAISTLSPSNTGGAVATYAYATPTTFGSLSGTPYTVATDPSGNVYTVDYTNGILYKYTSAGVRSTLTTGFSGPVNVAIESTGSIWVSDFSANRVYKLTSAGAVSATITGFSSPYGIAIDAANNVYVADNGNSRIIRFTSGSTTGTSYVTGLTSPYGITADPSGNLFISSNTANTIVKVPFGSTTASSYITTGLSGPRNLFSDSQGNIFVADFGASAIKRISSGTTTVTTVLSGLSSPRDLSIDPSGIMYIANSGTNSILKSTPTGGYFLDTPLPTGLSFNNTNGQISGTPTVITAATNYTITAYNAYGNSSTVVNITITAPFITGYAYRLPLTLNTTGLGISANLTKFPVLLKIVDAGLIYTAGACTNRVQFPNGTAYDFAFTDPSAPSTELPYQVESYDQTTGTLLVWVQVPTLYSAVNNTLDFYYGNATSPSTHTTAWYQNTWKTVNSTSTDYKGVWHFNETPSTSSAALTDASGSGNALTATGTVTQSTSSLISNGLLLSNSTVSKASVSNLVAINNTPITMSAWVYYTTYPSGTANVMVLQGNSGYTQMVFRNTAGSPVGINSSGNGIIVVSASTPAINNWHYFVYTFNGSNSSSLYIDGALTSSSTTSPQAGTPTNIVFGSYNTGAGEYYNGYLDESRVINTNLSANWVKAEYNNQKDPASFTIEGTTTTDATNVLTIPGGVIYTYSGSSYTPNVAGVTTTPSFNGKESFVFASSAAISATNSVYGVTVNSGNTLTVNSGQTLNVACNIVNNGTIAYGSNASNLTFNGSAATQTYTAALTSNTASVGNLTINNSAGGTVTFSGGPVNVYNQIDITKGNIVVSGTTTLTLKSTAALTASVSAIPAGYSITGLVSVERYVGGSASDLSKRGYRLLSSPVYAGTFAGYKVFDLNFLKTYSIVLGVGGTTNGFTGAGNASIYLFREDIVPNNLSFAAGNFKGIAKLNNTPSYQFGINAKNTLTNTSDASTYLPVGNGVLFFFRGNSTLSNGTTAGTKTTSPFNYPENTTFVQTGTLNTGAIPVTLWILGTTSLSYTNNIANNVAPNNIRGYNLVGNPYPSAINWEKYNRNGTNSSIYGSGSLPSTIYQFNVISKQYASYQQKVTISSIADTTTTIRPGTSSDGVVSNIISNGQGFFIVANASGQTLTFRETAKTSTQPASADLIKLMGLPVNTEREPDAFIRLKLIKDSINTDAVAFVLNNTNDAKYRDDEDAVDLGGNGALTSMSVFSADNVALSIDRLPLPKLAPQIAPLAVDGNTTGIYTLKLDELKDLPAIYSVWLMDAFKKDSLDMRVNNAYNFNIDKNNAGTFGNARFSLVIRQNPALKLKLLDFGGIKVTEGVKLNWVTENESNYTRFTVEKSIDGGKTYEVVGGKQSNGDSKYSLVDIKPIVGLNKYRLKQDDINGTISYSKVVDFMYTDKADNITTRDFTIFPNPTASTLNIAITSPDKDGATARYSIKITNINGTVVKTFLSAEPNWQGNVSDLIPGSYFVEIINNTTKRKIGISKFVKL